MRCCSARPPIQQLPTPIPHIGSVAWQFSIFFDGRTPADLLTGGIYTALANALLPGPFKPVSIAHVALALGAEVEGGMRARLTRQARECLHVLRHTAPSAPSLRPSVQVRGIIPPAKPFTSLRAPRAPPHRLQQSSAARTRWFLTLGKRPAATRPIASGIDELDRQEVFMRETTFVSGAAASRASGAARTPRRTGPTPASSRISTCRLARRSRRLLRSGPSAGRTVSP